ncbi:HEAT repeat domain-containing protein [Paenibacillus marinisediminis]
MVSREIAILSVCISALLILTLAIFCYITVLKWLDNRQNAYNQSFAERNSTLLYQYLVHGESSRLIVPDSKASLQAMEQLLNRYLRVVQGEEIQQRVKSFTEMYFTAHYRRLLKSKKWSYRMNALYSILEYRMDTLTTELAEMMERPKRVSSEEYALMCKIVVSTRHPDYLSYILQSPAAVSPSEYRQLTAMMSDVQFRETMNQFANLPADFQYSLIDMVSIQMKYEYIPILENLVFDQPDTDQAEQRIRILKAVANLGYTDNVMRYTSFVTSPQWEERMMVAKLLGSVGTSEAMSYLAMLMKDPSWWVRNQAAQALSSSKDGEQILGELTQLEFNS